MNQIMRRRVRCGCVVDAVTMVRKTSCGQRGHRVGTKVNALPLKRHIHISTEALEKAARMTADEKSGDGSAYFDRLVEARKGDK